MKHLFFFFLLTSVFGFTSMAQQGKVNGSVIDGSQKTIESATISLLKATDSSAVKFSVAGKEGSFVFDEVPYGKYLVSVTAVGHQKGYSPAFELSAANGAVKLKTIELIPVVKLMAR